MIDQSHLRQSSPLNAIPKFGKRPHRTADRMYSSARRAGLVLLASGIAINAWALFPSPDDSGHYVQLPETAKPFAAEDNSAREGVVGSPPVNDYRSMDAKLVSSKPTMYGLATVWYPSPVVNVSLVPLRAKLQALLMLSYSQLGDVDAAFVEAKLRALLKLPDSVLALLMEHPDLADLNEMLDAVFLGTSDLSGFKTELDKIDVTSVPGPSEKIDVIRVNGKPAYIVHSRAVQKGTENAAGSPVSALPPPPGEQLTVQSQVEAPAGLTASTFAVAPTSEPLSPPPAPAALSASIFTVEPTIEQLAPPPAPTGRIMSAFTLAPTSELLAPPPALAPTPTSTPTATTPTASVEPTGTAQTSQQVMTSGNKFEPGETATTPSGGNSSATNSPATQTAAPSTRATGVESPAEAGGVTGGGGVTSPSNNESGGTPSAGETSP